METVVRNIDERCSELKNWILHNAPQCMLEEKQLVEGSQERAYWAHGYLTALLDVLRLFARERLVTQNRISSRDKPRRAA